MSGNPSATRGILIVQDPEAREKEAYGHASQILGTTLQGRFVVIESKKHMKSAAKQHSWKGVKTIDEADLRIEKRGDYPLGKHALPEPQLRFEATVFHHAALRPASLKKYRQPAPV